MMFKIAPSILSANFARLEEEIKKGNIILSRHTKIHGSQNVLVMTSEFVRLPKYIQYSYVTNRSLFFYLL